MEKLIGAEDVDLVRIDDDLVDRASETLDAAKGRSLRIATAESCTGGPIAMVLSEAPGRPIISKEVSSSKRPRRNLPRVHKKKNFGKQGRSTIRRAAAVEALAIMRRCVSEED